MFSGDKEKEHWSNLITISNRVFFGQNLFFFISFSTDTIYEVVPFGNSGAIKFKLLSFEVVVNFKRSFKQSFLFYFMRFGV